MAKTSVEDGEPVAGEGRGRNDRDRARLRLEIGSWQVDFANMDGRRNTETGIGNDDLGTLIEPPDALTPWAKGLFPGAFSPTSPTASTHLEPHRDKATQASGPPKNALEIPASPSRSIRTKGTEASRSSGASTQPAAT